MAVPKCFLYMTSFLKIVISECVVTTCPHRKRVGLYEHGGGSVKVCMHRSSLKERDSLH